MRFDRIPFVASTISFDTTSYKYPTHFYLKSPTLISKGLGNDTLELCGALCDDVVCYMVLVLSQLLLLSLSNGGGKSNLQTCFVGTFCHRQRSLGPAMASHVGLLNSSSGWMKTGWGWWRHPGRAEWGVGWSGVGSGGVEWN